jgi:serpin B
MRKITFGSVTAVFIVIGLFIGCNSSSSGGNAIAGDLEYGLVQSDLTRDLAPSVEPDDFQSLVDGNNTFACDIYAKLKSNPGNLFYSPFSISQALAMTYAGAKGNTEIQMADVLHFAKGQELTHKAFNKLDLSLSSETKSTETSPDGFKLNVANSIWAQKEETWQKEFLDTVKTCYGAGIHSVDFVTAFEEIRGRINKWVEAKTNDKIKDLLKPGTLGPDTRMVLVNAIYFLGKWTSKFEKEATYDQDFTKPDKTSKKIPMMHQSSQFEYMESDGFKALQMGYLDCEIAMLVILPELDRYGEIESQLTSQKLKEITDQLKYHEVDLAIPKVKMDDQFSLADTLKEMGMTDAFNELADFSTMSGQKNLYISDVIHKAFVAIDEDGTEAAAATAVIMREMSAAPVEDTKSFIADHPFVFLIRDKKSGSILFIGRIVDPG